MEIIKIDDNKTLEAFYSVATLGNFTQAAKAQRVTLAQLSKRVAKLEDILGVRLFQRSTRMVSLTNEGQALLPKVETLLNDLKEIETGFESQSQLKGKIKITSVPFVAHKFLLPLMEEFQEKHPDVNFELDLSESIVNIIQSGFDIALRIQTPKDSNLIYKKLIPNQLILCATPKYLKEFGTPKKIEDLAKHQLLFLDIHENCKFIETSFSMKKFSKNRKIQCNNGVFLTDYALNGHGILLRSIWDVKDHLKNGSLVQVLKQNPIEIFGNVFAVIPSNRFLAPRIRSFLDAIEKKAKTWNSEL